MIPLRHLGRPFTTALTSGVLASALLACAAQTPPANPPASGPSASADCPRLRLADRWHGGNAEQIQRAIDQAGRCSWPNGVKPKNAPYAVFDWDNTVIKNDIAEATTFWMLRHDKILQPPNRDWRATSRYLTDDGANTLQAACVPLAEPGKPLPTSTNTRCADELLSVKKNKKTTEGKAVFTGYQHRHIDPGIAWTSQVLQGYTPAEVNEITSNARAEALAAPVGQMQKVGSSSEVAWIRYYDEIADVIDTVRRAGIEPWIVSASPKEIVEVWSGQVGIDSKHTIGITNVLENGRLSGHLAGCGGIRDGEDRIITYIEGKRCFINKVVLGMNGPEALGLAAPELRPVLAAGDATTDIAMLNYATGVRIAINREKDELMCTAYDNQDGRWVVNPMFIEPLSQKDGKYACSTAGHLRDDGTSGPLHRADGSVVPDQEDRVFGES